MHIAANIITVFLFEEDTLTTKRRNLSFALTLKSYRRLGGAGRFSGNPVQRKKGGFVGV